MSGAGCPSDPPHRPLLVVTKNVNARVTFIDDYRKIGPLVLKQVTDSQRLCTAQGGSLYGIELAWWSVN